MQDSLTELANNLVLFAFFFCLVAFVWKHGDDADAPIAGPAAGWC